MKASGLWVSGIITILVPLSIYDAITTWHGFNTKFDPILFIEYAISIGILMALLNLGARIIDKRYTVIRKPQVKT